MLVIAKAVLGTFPRVAQAAAPQVSQRGISSLFPAFSAPAASTTSLKERVAKEDEFSQALWQSTRKNFNLEKHPITSESLSSEELQATLKLFRFRGPSPEIRLPKGEDLKGNKQWAEDLLKLLCEKKRPIANYHFSTNDIENKRQASDTRRSFPGNDVEGLKRLAEDLKQGNTFEGTISLCNLQLERSDIREALAVIITQPSIRYQNIDQDGTPMGLTDALCESNPSLGGLLDSL